MLIDNGTICTSSQDYQLISSINWTASQICGLTASTITIILSIFSAKLIIQKSIFPSSTIILLLFNIFYANLHQVSYGIIAITFIIRSIQESDPCDMYISETECTLLSHLLFTGIGGMIYIQTGLMIERVLATFMPSYSVSCSRIVGVTLSVIALICSTLTFTMITYGNASDHTTLTCMAFPKRSAHRANVFLFVCVILTVFNLLTSLSLMYYNKYLEYKTRYKVRERFKKRETIDSTQTICFLALSQFITMFIYSFGVLVIRMLRDAYSILIIGNFTIWVYTIPYAALLVPLLLICRIRSLRANRIQAIKDITQQKITQEGHILEINRMWN